MGLLKKNLGVGKITEKEFAMWGQRRVFEVGAGSSGLLLIGMLWLGHLTDFHSHPAGPEEN